MALSWYLRSTEQPSPLARSPSAPRRHAMMQPRRATYVSYSLLVDFRASPALQPTRLAREGVERTPPTASGRHKRPSVLRATSRTAAHSPSSSSETFLWIYFEKIHQTQ